MELYGYCRISCTDQNESRQILAMNELQIPPKNIFVDKQSGKDFDRPAYQKLIKTLQSGDLLYIKSIDRLGRNYAGIQNQWRILTKEMGVGIVVIDLSLLDTRRDKDLIGTLISDIILSLLSFFAQSERETIRQRQAEGIAAARLKGVKFGRPIKPAPANFTKLINQWRNKQLSTNEILKACKMSYTTFYRRKLEASIKQKKNNS